MDVLYQTRIQKERFQDRPEDYEAAKGKYIVDAALMKLMKPHSVVMHPLPRVDEVGLPGLKTAPEPRVCRALGRVLEALGGFNRWGVDPSRACARARTRAHVRAPAWLAPGVPPAVTPSLTADPPRGRRRPSGRVLPSGQERVVCAHGAAQALPAGQAGAVRPRGAPRPFPPSACCLRGRPDARCILRGELRCDGDPGVVYMTMQVGAWRRGKTGRAGGDRRGHLSRNESRGTGGCREVPIGSLRLLQPSQHGKCVETTRGTHTVSLI